VLPDGPRVRLEPVATGLTQPLAMETPPTNPTIRYVADKVGRVHVHDDEGVRDRPLLDVSDRLATDSWEMGLLGLALHPDFEQNRKLYVRYSTSLRDRMPDDYSHTFVLSEFRVDPDLRRVVPDSERVVLELAQPGPFHQSGAIEFGPDGYLYVATGDGGPLNGDESYMEDRGPGHPEDWYDALPGGNGQDLTENLLGSILRIDVDGRADGKNYAVPDDNPLVGRDGLDEQWAWGFRNPYRMSFDGDRLLVGDVGYDMYEEIDLVQMGSNFGWNVREGTACVAEDAACPATTPDGDPLVDPVVAYAHRDHGDAFGSAFGSAVIGGYVYRGSLAPRLDGRYVFGDLGVAGGGRLFVSEPEWDAEDLWPVREVEVANAESGRLSSLVLSFARDHFGELYVLRSDLEPGSGTIYRLVAT
jgi:glucose/arabinose dehydrogenase